MGNMMSLNISDEVIKAAITEEVRAGIVKALGAHLLLYVMQ